MFHTKMNDTVRSPTHIFIDIIIIWEWVPNFHLVYPLIGDDTILDDIV